MCEAKETTTSQIREILEAFNSETKELRATNQGMKNYIGICKKELTEYLEQNTLHFKMLQTLPSIVIV